MIADYIRFLDCCKSVHETNTYTWKLKSIGGGQGSYLGGWLQHRRGGNGYNHDGQWGDERVKGHGNNVHGGHRRGNGVHVGAKGIHTTQPTPRADRDTSAVIKPITMEVGLD